MKRFLLSILFLCVAVSYAMAQYDGDDRDAINEDKHSATAAAKEAKKSLWSMWDDDPNNWERPVYSSKGWGTETYTPRVNINYRPPQPTPAPAPVPKPPSTRSKTISQMNSESKNNQINRTTSAYSDMRRQRLRHDKRQKKKDGA